MNPKISIVMPVYNSEKYLREAINSLQNQTYKKFEIICVDDGSTDQSLNILKNLQSEDSRIKIIQQQNLFAGVARNNGLQEATGKYIMFLDSDDVFEKNMLSYLVKKAEKNQTDIVFFGFYHFKQNIKHRSMMGIPYACKKITSAAEHKNNLFQIGQGVPWNRFYNLEFIKKTGLQFQGLQSNNDVFFSKAVMLYANRMLFLRKRFVNYRVSNENSLQGSYKLASGNFSKCVEALFEELQKTNLYKEYKNSFEKYVIENFFLTFKKAIDKEAFYTICEIERKSLERMNINKDSSAIKKYVGVKIFENIIDAKYEEALFESWKYMNFNYISKYAIESKIGRKILSVFKVKVYD